MEVAQGNEQTSTVSESTESTVVETPSTPVTPETPATPQPQAEQYTPNYKFKVNDKELEFDEIVRPVIKSKDHEAKLRDLYERAYGIDEVKSSREQVRKQFTEYKEKYQPIVELATKASKAYQAKDMDMFFEALGVPEKDVQKWVLKKLQMEELPPEQKMFYTQNEQLRRQTMTQQEELEMIRQEHQQVLAQRRLSELDQAMSTPDVASFVQAFDQRNGPGSFKNEVIMLGQAKWHLSQQDVPPAQLISELVKKFGFQAQSQPATPQAAHQPTMNQDVPVIPVVKGGSGSPAARQVKSLKDLEAIRKDKFGY